MCKKKINELVTNYVSYNSNYEQQALFTVTYYVLNITEHMTFGFTTLRPADTQASIILEE
jgi:phosphorylcholine metabolism protein LicD